MTAPRFPRVFSPVCECPQAVAGLALRLRRRDWVDAVIVDRDGKPVRTLATNEPHARGEATFRWDGRDEAGSVVPDGRYRLRIHLDRQRRTILLPNTVLVDTKLPRARILQVSRQAFSPDGNGVNDQVRILYRSSERATPILLVDGREAVVGRPRPAGRASIQWAGKVGGAAAAAGEHRLELVVRDRAGNESEPAGPVAVAVSFLHLTEDEYVVERGGLLRFRVATDALPYAWALPYDTRHGAELAAREEEARNAVAYRVAKDARPGRYELAVRQDGRADTAVVVITR